MVTSVNAGSRLDRLPIGPFHRRIMFLIGDKNRGRGFRPVAWADVVKSLIRENRLSRRTPASA